MLVVLLWTGVMVVGAIPFAFMPWFPTFIDAVFESTAGFTTTGATVLADVEVLPPSIQMWRCFSHWLGGVGIILLAIAILPLLGIGSMALYKAQAGMLKSERLKPRIIETARALWQFYVVATLIQYVALRYAGMNWFDAICHTFSTMGTGGFSTKTASVGHFESAAMEYIIVVFMIVAGLNFTVHYRAARERSILTYFRDLEFRVFLATIGVATFIITLSLLENQGYGLELAFRRALFQVASIASTTGFATENYELWAPLPQMLLFVVGALGANTGSTAGGIKSFRIYVMLLSLKREFKKMVERRGVFAIRIGGEVLSEAQVHSALSLVFVVFVFLVVSSSTSAALGIDMLTSITAAASCMFSVGPAFGTVGPAENYAHLPGAAKLILSFCMLAGRVEFFTLLLVFAPAFWRK
ncbi:MAG: TrkH family potassium uptake protein [Bryobacterales bacterium]|nr:TrkH family potassium uptake protein [Bryobacterales bacterium]